jgi:2-aminobenzoate-CoA ligase
MTTVTKTRHFAEPPGGAVQPFVSAHVDPFCRESLPPPEQWPELFPVPGVEYPERLNAATRLLADIVARLGRDRRALVTPEEQWSYGELLDRADQVARVLVEDLGLVPGNRVLVRAPNNPWAVTIWLAVLKAGGVVVLTMPMLRRIELVTLLELVAPDLALCDARLLDDLHAACDEAAPGVRVVPVGGDAEDDLVALSDRKPAGFEDVQTAGSDVALLAPTSGTTGRPKVTMHTHRDVLAIGDTFSRHVLQPREDDLFTTSAPLAFTFGLGSALVFPLHAGAAAFLVEKATPGELADLVAAHGVTVLSTAPTAYRAMLAAGKGDRLRGVRRLVSAGENLPKATWEAVHEATGHKIIDGIGATEMLHIFIASSDDDIRPGSTGRAVPGYLATTLDEDGNATAPGVPGRLAVKGPTGCRYLYGDRQTVYVQDGWNVTGDTYVRDEDGWFWYQARSDDMIVSAGYNIAGPEVEQAILGCREVLECAVVGLPDPDRGQRVTAYVVLRDGVTGDDALVCRIKEHVKGTLAPYKYPRTVCFVDALPKTATGKLQRYRLREQAVTAEAAS